MDSDGIFSVRDQVIAVTGGAGGIGQTLCQALATRGARIGVVDLDGTKATQTAQVIREAGHQAIAIDADILNDESIENMIQRLQQEWDRIDVLINTVGMNIFKNTLDLDRSEWLKLIDINLNGSFFLSQRVAQVMATQGAGRIINFISVTALFGSPGQAAYACAKAALMNLTKSLAMEWIRHNVRVNAISPVMTETPINSEWLASNPERKENIAKTIPLGRLGQASDYVGPAVFLSSAASDFVLGQTLFVDGGTSIAHPLIQSW